MKSVFSHTVRVITPNRVRTEKILRKLEPQDLTALVNMAGLDTQHYRTKETMAAGLAIKLTN